jgi:hypothetical protein
MRISLLLAIQLDRGAEGGSLMNDWSDYASRRLKKQLEDRRLKDQKFVEIQRLKNVHGLPLWNEIRRIVKENVEHLNTKEGKEIVAFEVTQNSILKVRANVDSALRVLQAEFNEDTGRLQWECDGKNRDGWELSTTEDGSVNLSWGMVPTTPASIAKQMLDALLFD